MGIIIPVLERRRFEFSFLGGSASQMVTIQPAIEAFNFYYAHLFVRVHARDMTSGQSLVLALYYTLPSDDDPSEFTDASSISDVTITSTAPSTVPGLSSREFSSPGAYLKLLLTATQASAPSTFYTELSAALVLREV
ncbi:MAG: hypothetical protein KBF43_13175 [Dermatophilaceae bacterium]|mgnify:CR=1 FL=1|nr:hypothetical protein [Gemmatimonadota bacterium]MBP9919534.1 hypothetical protein [Dermatophilaceae bacterium]